MEGGDIPGPLVINFSRLINCCRQCPQWELLVFYHTLVKATEDCWTSQVSPGDIQENIIESKLVFWNTRFSQRHQQSWSLLSANFHFQGSDDRVQARSHHQSYRQAALYQNLGFQARKTVQEIRTCMQNHDPGSNPWNKMFSFEHCQRLLYTYEQNQE